MPLPSTGGGSFLARRPGIVIRLFLQGHANRPFFHICVTSFKAPVGKVHPVEQLGTYDPMINSDNQKLLSLNIERTRYWMGQGAQFSRPVGALLGKAGFLPVHPRTYINAWRYRHKAEKEAQDAANAESTAASDGPPVPPSSSS